MKLLFATLALAASSLFAADVDGKWVGNMATPNGDIAVAFNFMANGETLTGNSVGPDGNSLKIENGKIAGNKISFSITLDFGGTPFKINYTGTVSPADIKLILDIMGMPIELTVKKAA